MNAQGFPKLLKSIFWSRSLHTTNCRFKEFENPILRTLRILKEDVVGRESRNENDIEKERAMVGLFPSHTDILIVGGGAIGSSIAYWLKEKTSREGMRVVVVEKDPTYSKSSTALSAGGLHQQYSLPENIQMSLYGAKFLRTIKKRFGDGADIWFAPQGYLVLADEANAQRLIDNAIMEKEFGVASSLLTKRQLKEKFPWMNVNDVELGSFGVENHGWFDPWALMSVMRYGATNMGTQYINAELVDFMFTEQSEINTEGMDNDDSHFAVNEAVVKMPGGEHKLIQFAFCIVAAGSETPNIARLARIGEGSGLLSVPLPIKIKTRHLFKFDCLENPPGINTPMTVDTSGIYLRRYGLGGSFIAGMTPMEDTDLNNDRLFNECMLPLLKNRVPVFDSVKMTKSWTGNFDYNEYDDTGIVGPHPYYNNFYLVAGFSGYGIQQAPAVGRAVAEMILDGSFKTIDLTRFGFDRLIVEKPIYEFGVL